jgi:cytochrome c biogenesis protein CcdA/thiol-disulfide isomerase/thioredoxin
MTLYLIAYVGGILTIVSPCILPILPFVFARADRPFVSSGLPMLAGMALTFAAVATLAAVGGGWAVTANELGRNAALALLFVFGLALLFPSVSERLMRPLVEAGNRLSRRAEAAGGRDALLPSLLLGAATGLLWAPCAGPILGLVLTGAALQGANAQTSLLLLAFAAGAATSLALALLAGGRVFAAMKGALGTSEWLRRGLGAAVMAAVVAIFFGLDTGLLTRVSLATTAPLEQQLLDRFHAPEPSVVMRGNDAMMQGGPAMMSGNPAMTGPAMTGPAMTGPAMTGPAMTGPAMAMKDNAGGGTEALAVQGSLPPLSGATHWLNGSELSPETLKGKVVLIDFWTYSCINCLRTIPYVRAWADKYKDHGLVVLGVHTPEFAFEKSLPNVERAIADLQVGYTVAVDNDFAIWRAFKNRYWPAHYFIDAQGRIRHHHFGEGDYDTSERVIRQLLTEAGHALPDDNPVAVKATGIAASSSQSVQSPETYVGYQRAENFISDGGVVQDRAASYRTAEPRRNEWGLTGSWTIASEHAALNEKDGSIVYRFHARDLHLVLGPATDGKPVRFRVTIDGQAPGDSHGMDIDKDGNGVVDRQRLYQLVRQTTAVADRTFEIKFLDPGVQAYAFTFG